MALSAGTKLGPYEILSPLGSGGMGEVYRARDTRLERTVAIKILPPHLCSDPELKQRFEREARALSSLHHPHICTLFDVGSQDGIEYLVLEYLDGETLAERLKRGPLPLEQVVNIGAELADALDKAHRQNIIHRDIKPGNVMLSKSGTKLMDFGLAKPSSGGTVAFGSETASALTITDKQTILGTAAYMSPEQVQGLALDPRSDIFSLGAVLYEMATGQRAFAGTSSISVLSAILEKQPPPITELQPIAPPALDEVITRCLKKDPEQRWQNARDLAIILGSVLAQRQSPTVRPQTHWRTTVVLGTLILVAAAFSFVAGVRLRKETSAKSVRLQIAAPAMFFIEAFQAISPNGQFIAFSGFGSETDAVPQPPMVWIRRLNGTKMTPLTGTEGAAHLFWSPDSRYIAFFAFGQLKKVPVEGGTPQVICDAPGQISGTWAHDGTILYATELTNRPGLFRVSSSGGSPTLMQLSDEHGRQLHGAAWPYFLPDGEHFLVRTASGDLYVGGLRAATAKRVVKSDSLAEYASGYLFYMREGNLVAQPFDERKLELGGEAVPIAAGVRNHPSSGFAHFSVSPSLISYQAGTYRTRLVLRDRSGRVLKDIARAETGAVRVSPSGHRALAEVLDPVTRDPELWLYDLDRGTGLKFAAYPGGAGSPIWSPDGRELIYSAEVDGIGPPHLYRQSLDGSPPVLLLRADRHLQRATDWSPDGTRILYTEERAECFNCVDTGDTWILSWRDGRKTPLLANEYTGHAQFSPDGKWIAFVQMQGTDFGVYVMPAGGGERQRVSVGGGITPRWRRDGKELFYQSMDSFEYWSVPVIAGARLRFGKPAPLFSRDPLDFLEFDVLPDGQHLLSRVPMPGTQEAPPTTVLLNWQADLRR